jgi:hypothetical protein
MLSAIDSLIRYLPEAGNPLACRDYRICLLTHMTCRSKFLEKSVRPRPPGPSKPLFFTLSVVSIIPACLLFVHALSIILSVLIVLLLVIDKIIISSSSISSLIIGGRFLFSCDHWIPQTRLSVGLNHHKKRQTN